MDLAKAENYIFDLRMAKIIGLYQIFDSETTKIYGHNLTHIGILVLFLFVFTISTVNVIGLYYLANDLNVFMYFTGLLINFLLSCYNIANILYHSKNLWKCMVNVTCCNFLSYQKYNKNVFKSWWSLTVQVLHIYNIIFIIAVVFWLINPFVIKYALTHITIRNRDGLYIKYRINIYNMFYMIPNDMYNNNFNIFLLLDIIICIGFDYFLMIFDYIIIIMFFAFSSQLETISDEIASLDHECLQNDLNTYSFYYLR